MLSAKFCTLFSQIFISFHFHDMESKLDSVEETAEVAEVEVHRTFNNQPVKESASHLYRRITIKTARLVESKWHHQA
jgi:hypothetical protein